MPDISDPFDLTDRSTGKTLTEKIHDNGDGTYTRVVYDESGGGGGGGGAATIADGADVAQGARADTAVQGDTAGSLSAKLRGLNKSAGLAIAQDGTDSTDANAIQATGGVGIRGWLSTLVSLFRAGTAHISSDSVRSTATLHRSAIAAIDKLGLVTIGTASGVAGGSLSTSATNYWAVTAYNAHGTGIPTAVGSGAPGGSFTAEQIPITRLVGSDGYDINFSANAAAPKWLARITEAQRAAGCVITAVGTVTTSGGVAGTVTCNVLGTGIASTSAPFTANNAYTPEAIATVGYVDCTNEKLAHVLVEATLTGLTVAPALTILPFVKRNGASAWYQGTLTQVYLLTQVGQSLLEAFDLEVDGSTGLVIALDTITGITVNVYVEVS
jgi:hypothetical protein